MENVKSISILRKHLDAKIINNSVDELMTNYPIIIRFQSFQELNSLENNERAKEYLIIDKKRFLKKLPDQFNYDKNFPGDSQTEDDLNGFIEDMEGFGWEPFDPNSKNLEDWVGGLFKELEDFINDLEKSAEEDGESTGWWREVFRRLIEHIITGEAIKQAGNIYEDAKNLIERYNKWIESLPAPKPAAGVGPEDAGPPKSPDAGVGGGGAYIGGSWKIEKIKRLIKEEGKKDIKNLWRKLKSGKLNPEEKKTLIDFMEWVKKQNFDAEIDNEMLWRNIFNGNPIPEEKDYSYGFLFWVFMVSQESGIGGDNDKKIWLMFRKAAPIDPRPDKMNYLRVEIDIYENDIELIVI